MQFCECCDFSVHTLNSLSLGKQIQKTKNLGMKNLLAKKKLLDEQKKDINLNLIEWFKSNLNQNGLDLIEWCVDFLIFYTSFIKEMHRDYKNKYITIWSFIYDFLKIPENSGYDYWLLSFLEYNNIMNHGCAIRCGNFLDSDINPYYGRTLSEDRKTIILEWINNSALVCK